MRAHDGIRNRLSRKILILKSPIRTIQLDSGHIFCAAMHANGTGFPVFVHLIPDISITDIIGTNHVHGLGSTNQSIITDKMYFPCHAAN